jgi:dihydroorotase
MIAAARAAGIEVTCDVGVHHLHLCETDIGYFDAHARLDPPLRAQRDRDALRAGLARRDQRAVFGPHAGR